MTISITYTKEDLGHLIANDIAGRNFTVIEQDVINQVNATLILPQDTLEIIVEE